MLYEPDKNKTEIEQPKRSLSLEKIFDLQDKALQRALTAHQSEWEFIKDCIELIINRKFLEENLIDIDKEKLESVRAILNDALSTLINSFKIALYGCHSDSMTLLRPVIEELTVMNYVVQEGLFDTASYELKGNLKNLKFENIVDRVKDGKIIKELHGRISNLATHGTASRIRSNLYDLNGKILPKVGVAIDPERTKRCLHEIMRASLYMVRILADFYGTKREIISGDFFITVSRLETIFIERFHEIWKRC